MIDQFVGPRPLKGWRGVALIAAIAVLVIALSNIFSALERRIGSMAASLMFILCGMGVAGYLLRQYVLGFRYECDGSCLRVCRVYGKRRRPMADIWLNGVQACGDPEDVRRRFPGARTQRAVRRDCPLTPLAVAYRDGGRTAVMVLQPGEEIREAILKAVKK